MYCLKNKVQLYGWGNKGNLSSVARLAKSGGSLEEIDDDACYAELWMGTHCNGPSMVKGDDGKFLLLKDAIEKEGVSKCLGHEVASCYGDIPFLFKVLSVHKALSIQTHPNKSLARKLHTADSLHYADSNHKPELVIALTEFEVLCGFRPIDKIFEDIKDLKIFQTLNMKSFFISNSNDEEKLKNCFSCLMRTSQKLLDKIVPDHISYIIGKKNEDKLDYERLVIKLYEDFGCDIGVLCPYFLNYFCLLPNEACSLDPNVPHAYIKGDCIECMACSDNVVRAGLTPKFKDVETLLEMLDYHLFVPNIFSGDLKNSNIHHNDITHIVYPTNFEEFALERIYQSKSKSTSKSYDFSIEEGPGILLVTKGNGKLILNNEKSFEFCPGSSFFICHNQNVKIVISDSSCCEFDMFLAVVNFNYK